MKIGKPDSSVKRLQYLVQSEFCFGWASLEDKVSLGCASKQSRWCGWYLPGSLHTVLWTGRISAPWEVGRCPPRFGFSLELKRTDTEVYRMPQRWDLVWSSEESYARLGKTAHTAYPHPSRALKPGLRGSSIKSTWEAHVYRSCFLGELEFSITALCCTTRRDK